ncbi:MAG TPA: metalloregulator ArsR/SmtB family transcription factor [Ktedonobacterales bacterium]|nr:metalloregulator ArsR/SmtB family transcription factor [Ktedonobacterales bacterium]
MPLSEPTPANRSRLASLAEGSGTAALAERLKALADPTRLRMLALLAEHASPLCVCEITPLFDLHQPTISHHLRLLREAGLADCERRGVWAYYWATEAGQRALALVTALA